MVSTKSNDQNTTLLPLISFSDIINNLEYYFTYQTFEFICLSLFFTFFIFWIFLNFLNKKSNLVGEIRMILYCFIIILSYSNYMFIFIDDHLRDFKNRNKEIYTRLFTLRCARNFILFNIVDLISIVFICTITYYRYRNFDNFINFISSCPRMLLLLTFKFFLYLIEISFIIFYFNINDNTKEDYLIRYLILIIINDFISRIPSAIIVIVIEIFSNNNELNPSNIDIELEEFNDPPSYDECMRNYNESSLVNQNN